MNLSPETKEILKTIFLIGVGAFIAYLFNKRNSNYEQELSKQQQKESWLKQFDIFQAEPLLELFKKILIKIEKSSYKEKFIEDDIISQLKAEIVIVRFLDKITITKLEKLLSICIDYNYYLNQMISGSIPVISTETEDIIEAGDNINKVNAREEDLRKRIRKQVIQISNSIRKIYPKENLKK